MATAAGSVFPSGLGWNPKPNLIPCYSRRNKTYSTSADAYQPGQTIKIPMDTANHGSVLDPKQTVLEWTMAIYNRNPHVDFTDFPICGGNIVFKAFRVMVNGNALEQTTRYHQMVNDLLTKKGINVQPYYEFRENMYAPSSKWVDQTHLNAVKPSMVDSRGKPMHCFQMFSDQADSTKFVFGRIPFSKLPVSGNNVNDANGHNADVSKVASEVITCNIPLVAINSTTTNPQMDYYLHFAPHSYFPPGGGICIGTAIPEYQCAAFATGATRFAGARMPDGMYTIFHTLPLANDSKSIASSLIEGGGSGYTCTPASWPVTQPGIPAPGLAFDDIRWADVHKFYSNCKNIPIGCLPSDPNSYIRNTVDSYSTYYGTGKTTYLRMSSPLFSGLIGELAEKYFPDMLIAPGKMWIELDLEDSRVVFQTSCDPCRRVPGTMRDWVPFTGNRSGTNRYFLTYNATQQPSDANYLLTNCCILSIKPKAARLIPDSGALPTLAANDTATTYYGASLDVASCNSSTASCLGYAGLRMYSPAAAQGLLLLRNTENFTSSTAVEVLQKDATSGSGTTATAVVNNNNQLNSLFSSIPVPQYVPCLTPWLAKDMTISGTTVVGGVTTFCNERSACFGTYLERAVAQVKRCWSWANNWNTSAAEYSIPYSYFSLEYQVQDVVLYTQQICLPESVADSVLASASSGAITYHTTFAQTVYNNAPQNIAQNLLMTVTGSSVKQLVFLFQSTEQLSSNRAYCFNSMASYNPFVALNFTQGVSGTQKFDVGGTYSILGANTMQSKSFNSWNMQLKIGNELYPRQPINTVNELIMENEKGLQCISDWGWKAPFKGSRAFSTDDNQYIQTNILEDGFFSVFTPIEALDDQTITGNPFYNIIELGETVKTATSFTPKLVRGLRYPTTYDSSSVVFDGVFNKFKPLDGCFSIVFNLEVFLNQGDRARSGTTIVNNQLFWMASGVEFAKHKIGDVQTTMCVTCLYYQDARVVFEAGGNCIAFL